MRCLIKPETPKVRSISITVLCVIIVSIGQALMKYGFNQAAIPGELRFSQEFAWSFFTSFISTPWIFTGYFLATISSILFLEALHNTELGITAAVLRLNYVTAYVIGVLYFQETFKSINLMGILLIFSGVVVISLKEDNTPSC